MILQGQLRALLGHYIYQNFARFSAGV
jgi:hypothetical protein